VSAFGNICKISVAENGLVMVLWVGQQFPPDSTQKVFGVPSLAQVNTDMVNHVYCDSVLANMGCSL